MTTTPARIKVLCVDDEKAVLDGLMLNLRRRYEVLTAQSGAEGLKVLEQAGPVAVIMSDMRMPGMDGATFLSRARQVQPDAVRLLLTGQADMTSAIAAINEGQIFRFLTKPCPAPAVLAAMDAAAELNRLISSERVLLEQTLHGSIKALTDVLALTNPISFGRATRIKQLVTELGTKLEVPERWQLEVAAMLSQLGTIVLPPETVEKVYSGLALDAEEQKMVARAPAVTEQLVRNIPRLEIVAEVLAAHLKPRRGADALGNDPHKLRVELMAQCLRAAFDFDAHESQGHPAVQAVEAMRARLDRYEPKVLEALSALRAGGHAPRADVREVFVAVLCAGMVFVEDVKTTNGMLLVARGFEVTAGFLERVRNMKVGTIREPLRVTIRPTAKPGSAAA